MAHRALSLLLSGIFLASPGLAQTGDATKSKELIAVIGGQNLYEGDLAHLIQGPLRQLRNQEYELKRKAIDALIEQKLLEAAAKEKGVSVEQLLEQEVNAKVQKPTEDEVESYYLGLKDKLNQPFDELKAQLQESLKKARLEQARGDYARRLREKTEVVVLLAPPKTEVSYDPARLRGNPDAPITIIEFSDFQCPFCGKVEPTLKELLSKYEGQVRLAYRDFPLNQSHPQAQGATEASRCAGEQGKFWEYHDRLFANQAKLDAASLAEHARELKLDGEKFDECLESGRFKAAVLQDFQEGSQAGVSGTPAFFINGIFLSGAQPAAVFEKTIVSELAALKAQKRGKPGKNTASAQ